ncbi:MAG: carboxyl transferase domain-containing protein, partial [Gaiellaceae bacterium]
MHAARLRASRWIELLVDRGTFEKHLEPVSADPLAFDLDENYQDQLAEARARTELNDAVLTGRARLGGRDVVIAAFDFGFLGGSLGIAAGERIVHALSHAAETATPAVLVVASSGARMQEGLAALFQMVRTSAAAVELRNARCPFVAVLADPTTGAPYASVANLADVVIAESGALIGFAGPRVVEAVTGEPTEGLHAEELLEKGIVDAAVPRSALRATVTDVVDLLMNPAALGGEPDERKPLPRAKLPADRWALVESIREDAW